MDGMGIHIAIVARIYVYLQSDWLNCTKTRLLTQHNQHNCHQTPFLVREWGWGTRPKKHRKVCTGAIVEYSVSGTYVSCLQTKWKYGG